MNNLFGYHDMYLDTYVCLFMQVYSKFTTLTGSKEGLRWKDEKGDFLA